MNMRHLALSSAIIVTVFWQSGWRKALAADKLPPGFKAFAVPAKAKDQYGNPVVQRNGKKCDPRTGYAYEIWLKKPQMELVLIPAGEFVVSSSLKAKEMVMRSCGGVEYHVDKDFRGRVRITRPFYLGKYEVTQAQWQQVVGTSPWSGREFVKTNARHAASCVGWDDCEDFLNKLKDAATFKGFCFPTEAQWEHACRAGTAPTLHGAEDSGKLKGRAWYKENAYAGGKEYAHPVGQKKPNP